MPVNDPELRKRRRTGLVALVILLVILGYRGYVLTKLYYHPPQTRPPPRQAVPSKPPVFLEDLAADAACTPNRLHAHLNQARESLRHRLTEQVRQMRRNPHGLRWLLEDTRHLWRQQVRSMRPTSAPVPMAGGWPPAPAFAGDPTDANWPPLEVTEPFWVKEADVLALQQFQKDEARRTAALVAFYDNVLREVEVTPAVRLEFFLAMAEPGRGKPLTVERAAVLGPPARQAMDSLLRFHPSEANDNLVATIVSLAIALDPNDQAATAGAARRLLDWWQQPETATSPGPGPVVVDESPAPPSADLDLGLPMVALAVRLGDLDLTRSLLSQSELGLDRDAAPFLLLLNLRQPELAAAWLATTWPRLGLTGIGRGLPQVLSPDGRTARTAMLAALPDPDLGLFATIVLASWHERVTSERDELRALVPTFKQHAFRDPAIRQRCLEMLLREPYIDALEQELAEFCATVDPREIVEPAGRAKVTVQQYHRYLENLLWAGQTVEIENRLAAVDAAVATRQGKWARDCLNADMGVSLENMLLGHRGSGAGRHYVMRPAADFLPLAIRCWREPRRQLLYEPRQIMLIAALQALSGQPEAIDAWLQDKLPDFPDFASGWDPREIAKLYARVLPASAADPAVPRQPLTDFLGFLAHHRVLPVLPPAYELEKALSVLAPAETLTAPERLTVATWCQAHGQLDAAWRISRELLRQTADPGLIEAANRILADRETALPLDDRIAAFFRQPVGGPDSAYGHDAAKLIELTLRTDPARAAEVFKQVWQILNREPEKQRGRLVMQLLGVFDECPSLPQTLFLLDRVYDGTICRETDLHFVRHQVRLGWRHVYARTYCEVTGQAFDPLRPKHVPDVAALWLKQILGACQGTPHGLFLHRQLVSMLSMSHSAWRTLIGDLFPPGQERDRFARGAEAAALMMYMRRGDEASYAAIARAVLEALNDPAASTAYRLEVMTMVEEALNSHIGWHLPVEVAAAMTRTLAEAPPGLVPLKVAYGWLNALTRAATDDPAWQPAMSDALACWRRYYLDSPRPPGDETAYLVTAMATVSLAAHSRFGTPEQVQTIASRFRLGELPLTYVILLQPLPNAEELSASLFAANWPRLQMTNRQYWSTPLYAPDLERAHARANRQASPELALLQRLVYAIYAEEPQQRPRVTAEVDAMRAMTFADPLVRERCADLILQPAFADLAVPELRDWGARAKPGDFNPRTGALASKGWAMLCLNQMVADGKFDLWMQHFDALPVDRLYIDRDAYANAFGAVVTERFLRQAPAPGSPPPPADLTACLDTGRRILAYPGFGQRGGPWPPGFVGFVLALHVLGGQTPAAGPWLAATVANWEKKPVLAPDPILATIRIACQERPPAGQVQLVKDTISLLTAPEVAACLPELPKTPLGELVETFISESIADDTARQEAMAILQPHRDQWPMR